MSSPRDLLLSLPETPGVYRFYDKAGKIIYVGKAKNLKKRVSSYFTKNHEHAKTRVLVKLITDIQYIVTPTELDALLLENSLIKEHQPRYNIQLKDDKTYPWIIIYNERFPRVTYTRNPEKDKNKYFGPYSSVASMRALLHLISELFPLRTCSYALTEENIRAEKFKPCLEFHMGRCLAPCASLQSEDDYNQYIRQITAIIKGDLVEVKKYFSAKMKGHAEQLEFERAQMIKEKLEALERYQAKTAVVNEPGLNADVITCVRDDGSAFVNYLHIINGHLVHAQSMEVKQSLDENDAEILEHSLLKMRELFHSKLPVVLTAIALPLLGLSINNIVPVRGAKKDIIDLSLRNAKFFMLDKHKQEKVKNPARHTERILATLQKDLRLTVPPRHIECFDNSNFQGTNAVSACVVFKDAKPAKKEYRHFVIQTVQGPDDFASMREVVYRRYKRLLEEKSALPDLIVIDGGKGQLGAALESLEKLNLRGKIAILGIAKRLEELYYPDDPVPLYLDKRSESLKIIQHLRNEAHRFGITHHRDRRSKGMIQSDLEKIPGIGKATASLLLKQFKSVKRLREADFESLEKLVGVKKATVLAEFFKNKIEQ